MVFHNSYTITFTFTFYLYRYLWWLRNWHHWARSLAAAATALHVGRSVASKLKYISSSGVKDCSNLFQPELGWTTPWTLPVLLRGNCCGAGYGEGSWGWDDSRKSGYVTKETETSLLNCLSDILQTAVACDFAVADEVFPLDVEDATLIPRWRRQ